MLTLATVSLPAYSPAISSSAGPIALQGPHHSAQKSTSTGPVAGSTSVLKLASLTGLVFALMDAFLDRLFTEVGERARRDQAEHGGRAMHPARAWQPLRWSRPARRRRCGQE